MDAARAFRDLKRERKHLGERDRELIRQEKMLDELIQAYVEQGLLTHKIPLKEQGGGTVFQKTEVWARITDDIDDIDYVTEVLVKHNLGHLVKIGVNSTSLSAWLRQELPDDEESQLLSVEERAAKVLSPELLSLLSITEKSTTKANGL